MELDLLSPFQFGFMQNAFWIALLLSPPTAILSCFLVLKGWSLMGDAISHAVLPGMVVFALGLALLVSPLTATVLAAAPDSHSGVASGINNAVARAGSLLAVAALPALVGLSGSDYEQAGPMTSGYRLAMLICAGLLALGGIISWVGLRSSRP